MMNKKMLFKMVFLTLIIIITSVCAVYATTPLLETVGWKVDNPSGHYVKNGDTLTITFTTIEPVNVKEVYIGSTLVVPKIDPTKPIGQGWYIDCKIANGMVGDAEKITYSINLESQSNPIKVGVKTETLDLVYLAPITINNATLQSNNAKDITKAINGDLLNLKFETNHPIVAEGDILLGKQTVQINNTNGNNYTATTSIESDTYSNDEVLTADTTTLKITDQAGNTVMLPSNNGVTYVSPIKLFNARFYTSNPNPTKAKVGDTIYFAFESNKYLEYAKGSVGSKPLVFANIGTLWTGSTVVTQGMFNKNETINLDFYCSDGFTERNITSADIVGLQYIDTFTVTNTLFSTSNENPRVAKNNDSINLSFSTSHKTTILSSTINNQPVTLTSSDNQNYVGNYYISPDIINDQAQIAFEVVIIDEANNKIVINQATNLPIIYYSPLTVSDLMYKSDNSNSSAYAINGNTITVGFKTNHETSSVVKINEKDVLSSENEQNHIYSSTIKNGDLMDNNNVKYSALIKDKAGNELALTDNNEILYYAPIQPTDLSFTSNNTYNNAYAKNGNVISLKFKTTHPIKCGNPTINNQVISIVESGKFNYSSEYNINEGAIKDQTKLDAQVTLTDDAGNEAYLVNDKNVNAITYYAPLAINNLSFISNNSQNGNRYIKNGDTATVSLSTNHNANVICTINERAVSVKGNASRYSMGRQIINNVDDGSEIRFNVVLYDDAGNDQVVLTEANTGNQLIYYAPLQGLSSIESDNQTSSQYVKVGDIVSTKVTANHDIHFIETSIMGREADINDTEGKEIVASQVLSNSDDEGYLTYRHSVSDVAGNTMQLISRDDNQIIFDKTSPTVVISPEFNGFINKNYQMNATYSDAHLDTQGISLLVNNKECYTKGDASGITYTKNIILTEEGELEISASCTDSAGNTTTVSNGKIIVDKTNPKFVGYETHLANMSVFKSGFVLSQYFKIDESNLKDVSCTLTNKSTLSNTSIWNIDQPIVEDGLKTITLKAIDMATNESSVLSYDFYIDGTAPKTIVTNNATNVNLKLNSEKTVITGTTLNVSLDDIWVGSEKPDRFTTLKLVDSKGNLVKDYLYNETKAKQNHDIKLDKDGSYEIQISASDDVENKVENVKYKVSVSKDAKETVQTYRLSSENRGWIIGMGIVLMVAFIVIIKVIVVKRKNIEKKN